MSGGCNFHSEVKGDCIHCLGHELALARAESGRLQDWIGHLVEGHAVRVDALRDKLALISRCCTNSRSAPNVLDMIAWAAREALSGDTQHEEDGTP